MPSRLSYPRQGAALVLYLVALSLLGAAVVAAMRPVTAALVVLSTALLFVSDLLVMRRRDIEPEARLPVCREQPGEEPKP